MLFDVTYKLARKSLPVRIYRAMADSALGRGRQVKRIETYAAVFDHYRATGVDFRQKMVTEVGSGDQFFTACFFLYAGARDVILVDPRLRMQGQGLEQDVARFERFTGYHLDPDYVRERVFCFADLSEVPWWFDNEIDFLCSHDALQHFAEIRSLFLHTRRLLSADGVSHHKVDLTDHTYHVFGKYPFARLFAGGRRLYHLRYSDSVFEGLNDAKCHMNRKLLPEYLELAVKYRLAVLSLVRGPAAEAVVHRDLYSRHPACDPAELRVAGFVIDLAHAPARAASAKPAGSRAAQPR